MMTEAELWHMQLLAAENTFIGMDNVATIIFAYLATAYFVGGKLSRFQAALATVFFVFVASVFSAIAFTEYRRNVYFLHELTENYGVSAMLPNDVILPVSAIVIALLILACVYFMYQVRRNAKTVESTD
jgi:ABC-type branched-subunit amino acid transport system permease subunit